MDYHSLSKEEKEELWSALDQDKKDQMYGLQLSRKGCAKDVMNICKKVEELVHNFYLISLYRSSAHVPQFTGIQSRDSVEGFYMISSPQHRGLYLQAALVVLQPGPQ